VGGGGVDPPAFIKVTPVCSDTYTLNALDEQPKTPHERRTVIVRERVDVHHLGQRVSDRVFAVGSDGTRRVHIENDVFESRADISNNRMTPLRWTGVS
jgi:hypothetical protein